MLERLGVELVITHLDNPEMERLLRAHGVIDDTHCACAPPTAHESLQLSHLNTACVRFKNMDWVLGCFILELCPALGLARRVHIFGASWAGGGDCVCCVIAVPSLESACKAGTG